MIVRDTPCQDEYEKMLKDVRGFLGLVGGIDGAGGCRAKATAC